MNFTTKDHKNIYVYSYEVDKPKAIIQIAHGMAEHAKRYEYFAKALNKAGYTVYANDHRGHGKSVKTKEELGIMADEDGFNKTLDDMRTLTNLIKEKHPNLPIVLFGHSMGSFLAQKYLMYYPEDISCAILSGSNGENPVILSYLAKKIAASEVKKLGRNEKSKKMNALLFGKFNKKFKPNRTDFDWLSTNETEVDKYVNDDYCGFLFSAGGYHDMISEIIHINNSDKINNIPKNLPILLVSGDKDPVSNFGKGVIKLRDKYLNSGIKNVEMKLYKGLRHEVLNENGRDLIIDDIINFINKNIDEE